MNSEPDFVAEPQISTDRLQYKWVLLLVVGFGGFLSIMNAGMVNIGAPDMIDDFQSNASLIVWVNLAFVMGTTVPLLPLSRMSDVFGRKRLYLAGALVVPLGLILSAISQDLSQLIAARVLTGIGSAMILANDNALVTQTFPTSDRGKAQGMMNMAFGLGIGLSFFLGGILVDIFDWRALFWARIPAQLLLAFVIWRFVRSDSKNPLRDTTGYSVDYAGVLLLAVVMVGSLLAINQSGRLGLHDAEEVSRRTVPECPRPDPGPQQPRDRRDLHAKHDRSSATRIEPRFLIRNGDPGTLPRRVGRLTVDHPN